MESYLFPSLIEKFMGSLRGQEKSQFTIIAYKKDLEQFVGYLSAQGLTDIREVKKDHIDGFIQKLLTDNYTKKSASRKLNSIRTFFRYLKAEGIVDLNPSLEVSHPKYAQAAPRSFSKLEYRAIRDVAKEDPRTYAMVELLLQTGIRIGELANIRLADIKDIALYIRAYGKNPSRDVPMNKAAKKAITDYLKVRTNGVVSPDSQKQVSREDSFLFITRTNKPLLIRNIRQIIARCFREVGIKDATVNDFRNTFITHQLSNNFSIEYIAKIVGHKRLSSTERFLAFVKEGNEKKEKLEEL